MPVQQMLRSMSSREITEWMAYFFLENEDQEKARAAALRNRQSGAQATNQPMSVPEIRQGFARLAELQAERRSKRAPRPARNKR